MYIQTLTLKNFKGVGEVSKTIDFSPITLLFGPNSAVKSTILHAFLYFYEILNNGNCSPGSRVRVLDFKKVATISIRYTIMWP